VRLIDELQAEHELIDAVAGSLRAYVDLRLQGGGDPADGPRLITFLRLYAGQYHHAREEDTLFDALLRRAHLPEDGPIATLRGDHRLTAALLERMDPVIGLDPLPAEAGRELQRLAIEYSRALWHHIDAENSVLFPESAARLRRHGVLELPSREMTGPERAAMEAGRELVARYPPFDDRDAVRGDGCVCCPALVEGCPGLERSWWNESEWEEFEDHLAAD
jgi:hemerythrin-like domain-containing protein